MKDLQLPFMGITHKGMSVRYNPSTDHYEMLNLDSIWIPCEPVFDRNHKLVAVTTHWR